MKKKVSPECVLEMTVLDLVLAHVQGPKSVVRTPSFDPVILLLGCRHAKPLEAIILNSALFERTSRKRVPEAQLHRTLRCIHFLEPMGNVHTVQAMVPWSSVPPLVPTTTAGGGRSI